MRPIEFFESGVSLLPSLPASDRESLCAEVPTERRPVTLSAGFAQLLFRAGAAPALRSSARPSSRRSTSATPREWDGGRAAWSGAKSMRFVPCAARGKVRSFFSAQEITRKCDHKMATLSGPEYGHQNPRRHFVTAPALQSAGVGFDGHILGRKVLPLFGPGDRRRERFTKHSFQAGLRLLPNAVRGQSCPTQGTYLGALAARARAAVGGTAPTSGCSGTKCTGCGGSHR